MWYPFVSPLKATYCPPWLHSRNPIQLASISGQDVPVHPVICRAIVFQQWRMLLPLSDKLVRHVSLIDCYTNV